MNYLQDYDTLINEVLDTIEAEVIKRNNKVALCTEKDLEDYTDEFYELPHSLFTGRRDDSIRVKIYALEVDEDNDLLFHCIDSKDSHYKLTSDDLLSDRYLFDILDRIESGNIY